MAKEKRTISLLEQALSLGQNGGIYYAGARVAPEEKQAVGRSNRTSSKKY